MFIELKIKHKKVITLSPKESDFVAKRILFCHQENLFFFKNSKFGDSVQYFIYIHKSICFFFFLIFHGATARQCNAFIHHYLIIFLLFQNMENEKTVTEVKTANTFNESKTTAENEGQAKNKKNRSDEKDETIKDEPQEVKISDVITAVIDDMLREEEESQKMADALLGGCLDLICTYSEGYKSRQPLYSCKTCFAKTGKLAGVCYGCAENCHERHELVELYTKRNFCCDCGNSKFPEKCKLYEEKNPFNGRNKYNENFNGIFCVCKKLYPPPISDNGNVEEAEDMIQCPVCEDWFHPTHVLSDPKELAKLDTKENEQFDLICPGCVQKLPWLQHYREYVEEEKQQTKTKDENEENICKFEKLKSAAKVEEEEANHSTEGFCLPLGWREQLCRCKKCQIIYEDSECQFLLEYEDTIDHFEQQNRERMAQQREEEKNKKKLNSNEGDALEQRELVFHVKNGIEQMEQHCAEFFAKRTAEKRGAPISKEDVEECFMELAEKRQRLMVLAESNEKEEKAAWTE